VYQVGTNKGIIIAWELVHWGPHEMFTEYWWENHFRNLCLVYREGDKK